MVMYWKYFKAVTRHKWFVFLECCKLGILWLGIVHDLSKFLPSEFGPYAQHFYGSKTHHSDGAHEAVGTHDDLAFDQAWLHHQHRNRHHWQRWLLTMDSARGGSDKIIALPMPDRYRKEMLADWRAQPRASGKGDTVGWYVKHSHEMQMHGETRDWIEIQLGWTKPGQY